MGAYLSVDLDFWSKHQDTKSATRFFRRVLGLNAPVTFVIEHEELIDDINKMKNMHTLYNVDYHSDIIAEIDCIDEIPEDYNWANYVNNRENADYFWIMPNKKCNDTWEGLCHSDGINPFDEPGMSGWKDCQFKTMSFINWKEITRVGVCLSPIFVEISTVYPIIKKLGVDRKKIDDLIERQPQMHKSRRRGVLKRIKAA
jgi:hypothetical protein